MFPNTWRGFVMVVKCGDNHILPISPGAPLFLAARCRRFESAIRSFAIHLKSLSITVCLLVNLGSLISLRMILRVDERSNQFPHFISICVPGTGAVF